MMKIQKNVKASDMGMQNQQITRCLKVKSGVKAGKVQMQDFHFVS